MLEISSHPAPVSFSTQEVEPVPDKLFLNPLEISAYAAQTLGSIFDEATNYTYFNESNYATFVADTGLEFLEELELDEEIHILEDEIRQIEQQKRILKMSSLPGSPLASPPTNGSFDEDAKLEAFTSTLEQIFPMVDTLPTGEIIKLNGCKEEVAVYTTVDVNSGARDVVVGISTLKKDSTKSRKRNSTLKEKTNSKKSRTSKPKSGLDSSDCDYSVLLTTNKKKAKSRKTRTPKKDTTIIAEVFRIEQILKIKNVEAENEDEYIDIL